MSGRDGALVIVVLDDYQGIAQDLSDWQARPGQPQIRFFTRSARREYELIEWVRDADVVVASHLEQLSPLAFEQL